MFIVQNYFVFIFLALSQPTFAREAKFYSGDWNETMLSQADEAPFLKDIAKAIPERLLANGIKKIGKIDLVDLVAQIDKITFRENSSFFSTTDSKNTRFSALYDPKKNVLVYNSTLDPVVYPIPTEHPDYHSYKYRGELLMLHESMGALGMDDCRYDKSVGMFLLSLPPSFEHGVEFPKLQEIVGRQIHAGGTTTVGGGGDSMSAWIKFKLVEASLKKSTAPSCNKLKVEKLLTFLLKLNVETANCDHPDLLMINQEQLGYCSYSPVWFSRDGNQGESQDFSIKMGLEKICELLLTSRKFAE